MTADQKLKSAVNGWKQAVSIIEAQQKALDWLDNQLGSVVLPKDEHLARQYVEIVRSARQTAHDYLAAMRKSEALAGGSKQEAR